MFTQARRAGGMDRVIPVANDVPMRDVDLVIEAAVEKLDLKKKIFAGLEAQVPAGTVLATNTSALSIDKIADGLKAPENVVGIHFFNPVHRMQLVEIVRGERTGHGGAQHGVGLRQGHRQAAGHRQGFAGLPGQPRAAALHGRGPADVLRGRLRGRTYRPPDARFRDAHGAAAA